MQESNNKESILHDIRNIQTATKSLPEQAAEQIRELIIERRLQAGDKLPNEFELMERLHVGRGTIREAVKILVASNVLEIRRGRGTYVAQHTGQVKDPLGLAFVADEAKLIGDLLAVRLQIEPWAAALAAQNATEAAQWTRNCSAGRTIYRPTKNCISVLPEALKILSCPNCCRSSPMPSTRWALSPSPV